MTDETERHPHLPDDRPAPPGAPAGPASPRRSPDELPEELDITVARPYQVPDNRKRRIAAGCYAVAAAACGAGAVTSGNGGLLAAAIFLGLVAMYHVAAAWPLRLDETAALAASAAAAGFPVGHASAQLAWRGLRSRPVWRVLLYSADEPPSKRGLVELDAVDGEILGTYTEDNPEDWSAYGFPASGGGGPGRGTSGNGGSPDRKSTRLNSSHTTVSRMPSSA